MQTTYRFTPASNGKPEIENAMAVANGQAALRITYSPSARIWRINRGWRRRTDKKQLGFYINPITGQWSKKEAPDESEEIDEKPAEEEKQPNQRIVPFVEDHRNILILTPEEGELSANSMATLQAALKRGIEATFQIESSEIVVEPLPDRSDRRVLLFYEAAEGGAGVLSRICHQAEQLAIVARAALQIMHFELPGDDQPFDLSYLASHETLREGTGERICEAGCYQCLLSYYNQPDHELIDRTDEATLKLLTRLAHSRVEKSGGGSVPVTPPGGDASLHARWIATLGARGLAGPDDTSLPLANGRWTADARYRSSRTLIFLGSEPDGARAHLEEKGYRLINFPADSSRWSKIFSDNEEVFGKPTDTDR